MDDVVVRAEKTVAAMATVVDCLVSDTAAKMKLRTKVSRKPASIHSAPEISAPKNAASEPPYPARLGAGV